MIRRFQTPTIVLFEQSRLVQLDLLVAQHLVLQLEVAVLHRSVPVVQMLQMILGGWLAELVVIVQTLYGVLPALLFVLHLRLELVHLVGQLVILLQLLLVVLELLFEHLQFLLGELRVQRFGPESIQVLVLEQTLLVIRLHRFLVLVHRLQHIAQVVFGQDHVQLRPGLHLLQTVLIGILALQLLERDLDLILILQIFEQRLQLVSAQSLWRRRGGGIELVR